MSDKRRFVAMQLDDDLFWQVESARDLLAKRTGIAVSRVMTIELLVRRGLRFLDAEVTDEAL
ncbi:MAG: hypothetical protein CMF70_06815 [Magnetovibrio sp.]|nr:hypothetical protein [Magnetovibrio sp.]|tara:strand:+ start:2465 stop:2650 length:186 start_codon:yes stop_codon:yes gene_type:complete